MSPRRAGAGVKAVPAGKPKAAKARGVAAPKPNDVLAAALSVSQCLDIEGQLAAFLDLAREWSGAADGVAFGPDTEGARLAALSTTLEADDARLDALRRAVRS